MLAKIIALALILVAVLGAGNGTLIKIKLHPESKAGAELDYKRQAEGSNACQDRESVERDSVINGLPGRTARELDDRVTFWRSEFLNDTLTTIQERPVPGLGGATVAVVFAAMRNEGCFPFIYGGAVRDQFLGVAANDVDAEVDCDKATALAVCIREWTADNCEDSTNAVRIGDPADIDLAPTEITFYAPLSDLEYTANSIAYDTSGTEAIIDLTAFGVDDVCNRDIRIPSVDDSEAGWDAWRDDIKVLRFWKLRAKGFSAVNAATQGFIVRQATDIIKNSPDSFYNFYCAQVYAGSMYDASQMCCANPKESCAQGRDMAALYDRLLTSDLGEVWTNRTTPQCSSAAAIGATITTMMYVAAMLFLTQLI